ncbi:hypothetical protein FHX57_006391 [Paraburkholderia tropica]|nr:hypothetical protein [Paraburkholderia tropica]MBB6323391.1 hypothetical protein [Paraburkholderia tropica]
MDMTDLADAIRGGLIQQDRLIKTEIHALPDNALVPRRAVTHCGLGRDFRVTLDMVSTASDIELKKLIAQPMTLWIQQADKSCDSAATCGTGRIKPRTPSSPTSSTSTRRPGGNSSLPCPSPCPNARIAVRAKLTGILSIG